MAGPDLINLRPTVVLDSQDFSGDDDAFKVGFPPSLPYLLAVRQITVREIQFYVKDLFMGVRGQVEAASLLHLGLQHLGCTS